MQTMSKRANRNNPPRALRCLIVEDQTMFLQLLVGMLRTMPGVEVRTTATTAAAAITACRDGEFDLLILDLKLPDGKGIDVLRVAVETLPDIECIVLSSAADISERLGITRHTVETHRKSIAAKLDAKGAELVRMATIHNQTSLPE